MHIPSTPRTLARLAFFFVLLLGAVFACGSCRAAAETAPETVVQDEPQWPGDEKLDELALAEEAAREDLKRLREESDRAAAAAHGAADLYESEALPPGEERPSQAEVEALQKKAQDARRAYWERYRDILVRFHEFLEEHPNNWHAQDRLAWFYADHGDYLSASEHWRQVIALKADFAFGYNNLGSVYNHLGRDMEAVDLYLRAIELKADEPEFHFNLANVYATRRTEIADKFGWDLPRVFREALNHYRAARDLRPDDYEYAQMTASHFVMAHYFEVEDWADEAIEAWRYCLNLELTDIQRSISLTNLARIYLRQKKDPAKARELLLEAKENYHTPTIDTLLQEAERLETPATL